MLKLPKLYKKMGVHDLEALCDGTSAPFQHYQNTPLAPSPPPQHDA